VLLPFAAGQATELKSPNGELAVVVDLDENGRPGFQLFRNGEPVIRRSPLGISLDHADFRDYLEPGTSDAPKAVRVLRDRGSLGKGVAVLNLDDVLGGVKGAADAIKEGTGDIGGTVGEGAGKAGEALKGLFK